MGRSQAAPSPLILSDALTGKTITHGVVSRKEVSGTTHLAVEAAGYLPVFVEDIGQGRVFMWTPRQKIFQSVGKELHGEEVDIRKLASTPVSLWPDFSGERLERAERKIFAPFPRHQESKGGET